MSLLYRALDEESQLLAKIYNEVEQAGGGGLSSSARVSSSSSSTTWGLGKSKSQKETKQPQPATTSTQQASLSGTTANGGAGTTSDATALQGEQQDNAAEMKTPASKRSGAPVVAGATSPAGGAVDGSQSQTQVPTTTTSAKQNEIAVILFALTNLQEHTLSWKQAIMVAYEEGKPVSFRDLAHFLDESIAVLEALYWKKKALQ